MEINVKDLKDYYLKKLWVCDYRRPDLNKKAARSVPPTEVIAHHYEEILINTRKKTYYSNYGFYKVGKNGLKTNQVIQPYDNTGFRSYSGVPLNIFDDKKECFDCWLYLVDTVIGDWGSSDFHSENIKKKEIDLLNKKVNLVKKQLGLV